MPTKRESTKMFHLHYKELDMGNQEKFRPQHAKTSILKNFAQMIHVIYVKWFFKFFLKHCYML